jgi:hypothetical protein
MGFVECWLPFSILLAKEKGSCRSTCQSRCCPSTRMLRDGPSPIGRQVCGLLRPPAPFPCAAAIRLPLKMLEGSVMSAAQSCCVSPKIYRDGISQVLRCWANAYLGIDVAEEVPSRSRRAQRRAVSAAPPGARWGQSTGGGQRVEPGDQSWKCGPRLRRPPNIRKNILRSAKLSWLAQHIISNSRNSVCICYMLLMFPVQRCSRTAPYGSEASVRLCEYAKVPEMVPRSSTNYRHVGYCTLSPVAKKLTVWNRL